MPQSNRPDRARPSVMLSWLIALALAQAANAGQIKGRVLDVTNQSPVKNATVRVAGSDDKATTDEKGNFDFPQVKPGSYELTASAPGYYDLSLKVQVSDSVKTDADLMLGKLLTARTVVTVSGDEETVEDTSRSVAVVDGAEIAATRLFSLDEVLNGVPGVRAELQSDTDNVRVSIRGRGIRTSFGMRGIKVLVDGIPESDSSGELPDMTGIDVGSLGRVEIVKGPMSAEYGANSGGVLNLITAATPVAPEIQVDNVAGSFGYLRTQAEIGGRYKRLDYFLNGSRVFQDGFRTNSRLISYKYDNRIGIQLTKTSRVTTYLKGGRLDNQLPGNITQAQLDTSPDLASPLFVAYGADEKIKRVQGAIRFDQTIGSDSSFSATYFQRVLDYHLAVPFLYEEGHRPEFGTMAQYVRYVNWLGMRHKVTVGGEYQGQHEDRHDFGNSAGAPIAASRKRDEIRRVNNTGGYAFDQIQWTRKVTLNLGVNYSSQHFSIQDFLANNSGANTWEHASFQAGAAYHFTPRASIYGNVSTGFETPTMTELGRNPNGSPGINLSLKPDEQVNFEGGLLFRVGDRAHLDVSGFQTRVTNEIVPTGITVPTTTYTNAGRTVHNGVEVGYGWRIFRDLDFRAAYTYSDFYYADFVSFTGQNFSGNKQPALPQNDFGWSVSYHTRLGIIATFKDSEVGTRFANDSNTVTAPEYNVAGTTLGYIATLKTVRLRFRVGVDNLFNQRYSSYIVQNDSTNSFFYPAPRRNYFGSVNFVWGVGR